MNKIVSLVLLAIGVVLIIYGVNASDSVSSGFSRLFTGAPTDKTLWLLIGGVILAVVGLGGLLRGSKP
jgi:amino acid permease